MGRLSIRYNAHLLPKAGAGAAVIPGPKGGVPALYVVNDTRFKDSALKPLVGFVLEHSVVGECAWLHMVEGEYDSPMEMTGGLAEANSPFPGDDSVLHKVTMWLQFTPEKYPFTTCHRKRTGKVIIRTWEEEFVLVLAHELRHIHQYVFGSPRYYEADAERHAIEVLNKYRASNRKAA